MICTTFRSDFHVGWKNQNKHSTLNLSIDALSKWHDLHINHENNFKLQNTFYLSFMKKWKKGKILNHSGLKKNMYVPTTYLVCIYLLNKRHSSKRHKAKILIIRARMTKGKCKKGRRGILNWNIQVWWWCKSNDDIKIVGSLSLGVGVRIVTRRCLNCILIHSRRQVKRCLL